MTTYIAPNETLKAECYLVDATDQVLGRLSTRIATVLQGKHRPTWSHHQLAGDQVIVINAEKIRVTGRKRQQKMYKHYTGYPGGLREETFEKLQARHPDRIIVHAVKGMLPKNKLADRMLKHLSVYAGPNHPHSAQKPKGVSW